MAELLRLSKKNRERLSAKDRKALDSARSAIEMKIKVQKDASKGGKTQIAKNLQSQINRAISRFNKNITKYRKIATTVSPAKDIDEDVAGRDRPVPVIKSPTDSSSRRPTQAEREKERKKREAARRKKSMQTVLGDVDPSRYKDWKKPKAKAKTKPSRLSAAEREKERKKREAARRKQTMEIGADLSGLESGRGMPKKKKKVQKPKVGTPAFSYGARTGRGVWDSGKLTKKDLANLVGQEALDFPKSLPKSRRRGPLGDTSYAAIFGDVDPSRYKGWKKPEAEAKPPVVSKPPKPPAKPPVVSKPPKPPAKPPVVSKPPKPPAKPPVVSKPPKPPAKPPVVSKPPKPKRKPGRRERYPSRADPDLGIAGVSRRIKTTKKPVDKAKKTKKAKELSGLEQFWEDVKKLPKYLGTDLLPERVSGTEGMGPGKRKYKWDAPFVGEVEFELDTTEKAMTEGRKKGGRIKKGVKKTKTRKPKVRRRAALRGHRAERRGG